MNKEHLIQNLYAQKFSPRVVEAFNIVPRENFVPEDMKQFAYIDDALPLVKGATISQPSTIAFMLELLELKKGQKVLEIGSGSGYVLALLAEITGGEIYGIEILPVLAEKSKETLKDYKNIHIVNENGFHGLPEKTPFDKILISASTTKIPAHLLYQLSDNGILVAPVRNSIFQVKKMDSQTITKEFPGFIFVPLRE